MIKSAWILLVGLSLHLLACAPPPEQEAISKQNDIAIANGFCTDLTVTALNKVHLASVEEAAEPCLALQSLLNGRTCENSDQIFPEDEQLEKCDLALKKDPTVPPVASEPVMIEPPIKETMPPEMTVCSTEVFSSFAELKKMKTSLEQRKSRRGIEVAQRQCARVESLIETKPCLARDPRTGQLRELTLKSAGFFAFCRGLKNP